MYGNFISKTDKNFNVKIRDDILNCCKIYGYRKIKACSDEYI